VNSINWARIAAQVVYFLHAALALGGPQRPVSFAVPTGNFGDIYAGYVAKQMGLPVERLIIGTNANDILVRALESGEYALRAVIPTTSPSMDIQISSNFERVLHHASNGDSDWVRAAMGSLRQSGRFFLPGIVLQTLRHEFDALASNETEISDEIARVWRQSGYLLDPHTATATRAARRQLADNPGVPVVALATAHPAKFPDAVARASGVTPALPGHLADLFERHETITRFPNSQSRIERYIDERGMLEGRASGTKGN
jgi:threonine synthase